MVIGFNKILFWRLSIIGLVLLPFVTIAFMDGSSAQGIWKITRTVFYYVGYAIIYPSLKVRSILGMDDWWTFALGYVVDIFVYAFIIERLTFLIKGKKNHLI